MCHYEICVKVQCHSEFQLFPSLDLLAHPRKNFGGAQAGPWSTIWQAKRNFFLHKDMLKESWLAERIANKKKMYKDIEK